MNNAKKRAFAQPAGGIRGRLVVLTASNLLLQALGFVYRMMLTRLAGSEALGLQSLVMQVYSIMVSVAISGLNVAVLTSAARRQGEPAAIGRLTRAALALFLLLFFAAACPIFVLRGAISARLIGDADAALAVVLVLACILMTGIENVLKSVHIACGLVARTAISELLEQGVRFAFVFLLLKFVSTGEDHEAAALIMLGMLGSEFFSVSFLSLSYKKTFRAPALPSASGAGRELGELVSVLAPAGLTSLVTTLLTSASMLLLPGRLMLAGCTRSEALSAIGVMNTVAVPIVMLPMSFIGALGALLLPAVSAASSRCDGKKVKGLAIRALYASALPILIFNVPMLPFLGGLTGRLFGVVPTGLCFALLTVKAGVIYLQFTATAILNGMMKQRRVLLFAVVSEAAQLVMIYALAALPALHIYGCLIAMCAGEALRLLLELGYLARRLRRESP